MHIFYLLIDNFQIYLYQRWVYRVDPKRVNEFGVSMEPSVNDNAAVVDNASDSAPLESKKEK